VTVREALRVPPTEWAEDKSDPCPVNIQPAAGVFQITDWCAKGEPRMLE